MSNYLPEADWELLNELLRSRYQELTDKDLILIDGDWETLILRLQDRYGHSREQAESELEKLLLESQF